MEIVEGDSPKRKKADTEAEAPRDVEEEIRTLRGRILIKANAVMVLTTFEGRFVEDDVKVEQDKKKGDWYSANVKCPICNKVLQLAFAHRTSTSLANFKRHLSLVHLKRSTKPGVLTGATSNQPKISDAFKKNEASNARVADETTSKAAAQGTDKG